MSDIRQRDVVLEIIGAMLAQRIIPMTFEIEPAVDEGWRIEGLIMGHILPEMRHTFHGTASPDGTSWVITSGAFGKLTEEGLDVFADLSGAGVAEGEEDT